MEQPSLKAKPPKQLELVKDYSINLIEVGITQKVKIHRGFVWDGASIPRVFWLTIGGPYHPKFSVAGLVHDYLYRTQPLPRKEADEIFYRLLRFNGVSYITAKRMYLGVRTGGIFPWKKHRERNRATSESQS